MVRGCTARALDVSRRSRGHVYDSTAQPVALGLGCQSKSRWTRTCDQKVDIFAVSVFAADERTRERRWSFIHGPYHRGKTFQLSFFLDSHSWLVLPPLGRCPKEYFIEFQMVTRVMGAWNRQGRVYK
jgi:hypothetical protein